MVGLWRCWWQIEIHSRAARCKNGKAYRRAMLISIRVLGFAFPQGDLRFLLRRVL